MQPNLVKKKRNCYEERLDSGYSPVDSKDFIGFQGSIPWEVRILTLLAFGIKLVWWGTYFVTSVSPELL